MLLIVSTYFCLYKIFMLKYKYNTYSTMYNIYKYMNAYVIIEAIIMFCF